MRTAIVFVLLVAIAACTFSEPRLRPEPIATAQYPFKGDKLTLNGIDFRCAEWHSWTHYPGQFFMEIFTGWHSAMDECVYLTVDPETVIGGGLLSSSQGTRYGSEISTVSSQSSNSEPTPESSPTPSPREIANSISHKTDTLIAVSDYNCNNFLAKAFAAKTGTDFGSSLSSTILSGSSAVLGLAGGIPVLVPAAISAGNSAIAGGTAAFDSNFFAKQSFDIMENGILSEREKQRAQINARICETYRELPKGNPASCVIPASTSANYPGFTPTRYWVMSEALSDIVAYDRVCSIEGGLRELSNATSAQKSAADAAAGQGTPTPTPSPTPTPTPPPPPPKKPAPVHKAKKKAPAPTPTP